VLIEVRLLAVSRLTEVAITAVPAGTSPALLSQAGIRYGYAAVLAPPHSNSVPSLQMQCRITAILRAITTLAFFNPIRFISRTPQVFSVDHLWLRCSSKLAASNK
jgi:hypothetical protein